MAWSNLSGQDLYKLSNNSEFESLSGAVSGVYLTNKISKIIYLRHEIYYSKRYLNIKFLEPSNYIFTSNMKRQYVDLFPLNAVFQYKGFQFYTGPYFGFLTAATIQRKDTLGKVYVDRSFYYEKSSANMRPNKIDVGLVAGIEYEFKVGLNFGVNIIKGFVPAITTTSFYRIYNHYLAASIGWSFQ